MSFLIDFLTARAARDNPDFARNQALQEQRRYDQQQANKLAEAAQRIYGQQPKQFGVGDRPMVGPLRPGTERPMLTKKMESLGTPGTGLLANASPTEARYLQAQREMATSGIPGLQEQQSALLQNMQNSMIAKGGAKGGDNSGYSFGDYSESTPEQREIYDRFKGRGFEDDSKPSDIKIAQYYAGLTDEQKKEFRDALRSPKYEDLGTHKFDPYTGELLSKNLTEKNIQEVRGQDIAKRLGSYQKARMAGEATISSLERTIGDLTSLAGMTDWDTAGFASWINFLPASESKDWFEAKEVIESNIALESMAELKRLSPSGSTGLGPLSDNELLVLKKKLGSLEQAQSEEAIKKAVIGITDSLEGLIRASRKAQKVDDLWFKKNNSPVYRLLTLDEIKAAAESPDAEVVAKDDKVSEKPTMEKPNTGITIIDGREYITVGHNNDGEPLLIPKGN